MSIKTVGEHSDNIEPVAGLMLVSEGNAFSRGSTNMYYGLEGFRPWIAPDTAWTRYLNSKHRSVSSLVHALRVVTDFAENALPWHDDGSFAPGGIKSILELSLPVVSVARTGRETLVTLESGVLAWDGLLLRRGDRLTIQDGASCVIPDPGVRRMPLARCCVDEFTYDTYNGGKYQDLTQNLDRDVLDLLDPDGNIREAMREQYEVGEDEWDDELLGVKYLSIQALNPPQCQGPVALAEIEILNSFGTSQGSLKFYERYYDSFLTVMTDPTRPIGYVVLERFTDSMNYDGDCYAKQFKLSAEDIDRAPPLADSIGLLKDAVARLSEISIPPIAPAKQGE